MCLAALCTEKRDEEWTSFPFRKGWLHFGFLLGMAHTCTQKSVVKMLPEFQHCLPDITCMPSVNLGVLRDQNNPSLSGRGVTARTKACLQKSSSACPSDKQDQGQAGLPKNKKYHKQKHGVWSREKFSEVLYFSGVLCTQGMAGKPGEVGWNLD